MRNRTFILTASLFSMLFVISTGLAVQAISPVLLPRGGYVVPNTFNFFIRGGTVSTEGSVAPGFTVTLKNTHDHTLEYTLHILHDESGPPILERLVPIEPGEVFKLTATEAGCWVGSSHSFISIVYGDVLSFHLYVKHPDIIFWQYDGFIIVRGRP
jgi:hypothetical protein